LLGSIINGEDGLIAIIDVSQLETLGQTRTLMEVLVGTPLVLVSCLVLERCYPLLRTLHRVDIVAVRCFIGLLLVFQVIYTVAR
jgi:hypothetical protein